MSSTQRRRLRKQYQQLVKKLPHYQHLVQPNLLVESRRVS
jgi:hypothetical protein